MSLWRTRRHWEHLARTDPFWGVLAEPDKQGNRWQVDEFFARGRKDVRAEMDAILGQCPQMKRSTALDFGCGVGRLTQALADYFERVTGVDVSEGMVTLASAHNKHGERVTYLHNPRADLSLLASDSFDFIYSIITLQHIPPAHAKTYIGEFIRVLSPGGLAFFQVPDSHTVPPKRRLSLYPPTVVKKARRFLNKYFLWDPVMEMNVIPKHEVLQVIEKSGAKIVSIKRHDDAGGDFVSFAYLVRKP